MEINVWAVQLELFSTLHQKHVKLALQDLFSNQQHYDVYVQKIHILSVQNVSDAIHQISGIARKNYVYRALKLLSMIIIKKNVSALQSDLLDHYL